MARKNWTEEEVKNLIKVYPVTTNCNLVKKLNRSYLSIYKKAYALGLKKTKDIAFITRSEPRLGENCVAWRGGKRNTSNGYIQVLIKDHPRSDSCGYVMEHIVVMEKLTGKHITQEDVVHHINGNKKDNRPENLMVMSFGEHSAFHNRQRSKK